MTISPWFRFFRLPNLPTAPGDALAGAAVSLALAGGRVELAFAAAGAAFFLYLYGLADNDVVGAAADAVDAPERPIPSGEISLRTAKIVRSACLFCALLIGALARLPAAWWLVVALLTAAILRYNRAKGPWRMGGCRGLSVICGAAALLPQGVWWTPACTAAVVMAAGWTLYIAAVTKLSEGEERASEGLGNRRYLLGLAALTPFAACAFVPDPRMLILPALGCLWTFFAWCAAVAPLWRAHGPAQRRAAVGRAIGALLYLQLGFILVAPNPALFAAAVSLWLAARFIRRLAPTVSGS